MTVKWVVTVVLLGTENASKSKSILVWKCFFHRVYDDINVRKNKPEIKIYWKWNRPRQQSVMSAQATSAPALAPATFCATRCGAYSLQQLATPTWYIPRNPQPENDRCGTPPVPSIS